MERKLQSILNELADYVPHRNRDQLIESRGLQCIASAAHLIRLIRESYDPAVADDLCKRLVRAIQSGDEQKFGRRMRSIRESRGGPTKT